MRRYLSSFVAVVTFVVYLTTMNPTVSFIDTGELAAVFSMLGIAHPTGYPLFTILGRIAASLPIPGEPILILNVFGALLTSLAAALFFELTVTLSFSDYFSPSSRKRRQDETLILAANLAGAFVLGLSTTFWAQSVALEVYSLHLVFLMLLLFTFVRGMEETIGTGSEISRHLLLFAFLLGLSFTNHLTTLLVLPACGILFFRMLGLQRDSLKILGRLIPFFFLGLSLYLYLPVRSAAEPLLNWGYPSNVQRIIWHVSGKQYRSWIFSGFESAERQLTYFVHNFPSQFHWVCLGLLLLGGYSLLRDRRILFWFIFLLALGCLAYSINYDIHDIDSYFLLAYVSAGILITFGLQKAAVLLSQNFHRWVLVSLIALVPMGQYWMNHVSVDESDNFLVYDYTRTILETVDTNAVIFSYQWDYFVSASYYVQFVENRRPDVAIIDKELLRRSWYFVQLKRHHPWLIERSQASIDRFLKELHKFEHDLPYDGRVIEARFNEMINDMIRQAVVDRPVYVGPEIEPQFAPEFQRIPEGLLLRVGERGEGMNGDLPEFRYRPTSYESRLVRGIRTQYAQMLTIHAIRLKNGGFGQESVIALEKAFEIDPTYRPAIMLLGEREPVGLNK